MNVVVASLALGLLGLVFAGLLALFYRRFAVHTDPKAEELLALLPGSNCGASGFPGCQGLAEALLAAQTEATGCVAGGTAVAARGADFMGVSVQPQAEMVAFVACRAGRYAWNDLRNCLKLKKTRAVQTRFYPVLQKETGRPTRVKMPIDTEQKNSFAGNRF